MGAERHEKEPEETGAMRAKSYGQNESSDRGSGVAEAFRGLTSPMERAKLAAMKRKKARVEKTSVGAVVGAKYRARCNELSDSEREKLNDEFLKLYYADSARQPARRR